MLFNVEIWVNHDEFEMDPQSWITGPDDDFVPAEYNSVTYFHKSHDGVTWNDVMDIQSSWAFTPGDHSIDVKSCAS